MASEPDRRTVIAGAGVLAVSAIGTRAAAQAPAASLPAPKLTHGFTATVLIDKPVELGLVDGQRKRVIAITGGHFAGARIKGVILPGGADWQTIRSDGVADIFARYTLRADDGTIISVTNPGFRRGPADVIKQLAEGKDVNPALYYFRTTPRFEVASDSPHAWLGETVFICTAARYRDHVRLDFFAVE